MLLGEGVYAAGLMLWGKGLILRGMIVFGNGVDDIGVRGSCCGVDTIVG